MPTDTPRLLILGAHPDDAEYHAGGLATIYRQHGYCVKMVSVTDGDSRLIVQIDQPNSAEFYDSSTDPREATNLSEESPSKLQPMLERVIDLSLETTEGRTHPVLEVLHRLVAELVADKPLYRCGHCGFEGRTLHWQCPGCRQWSSVKPIHGIEGV